MDIPSWLEPAAEFYRLISQQYAFWGIAAVMFAESAGVPFISSLVVLTAGGMIVGGQISLWGAIVASTLGIVVGSSFSYMLGFLGRRAGKKLTGVFFKDVIMKTPYHETRAYKYFKKYGSFSVFAAQLVGTTRTFISFPAGAMEMNLFRFIAYTTLGGLIFSVFAIVGSLVLNTLLGLIFAILNVVLNLPPWVWALAAVFIFFLYYLYLRYGKNYISQTLIFLKRNLQAVKKGLEKYKRKLFGIY